jgi:hypothetical protein
MRFQKITLLKDPFCSLIDQYVTNIPYHINMYDNLYSVFGKSLWTYKRFWKRYQRTIVCKNWIKQLNTLPVLHFNHCLTTEYSETTANFNGNFDTDNQIYVP